MTQKEINIIAKQAQALVKLNVTEFLKMIKEKAIEWKRRING